MAHTCQYRLRDLLACASLGCPPGGNSRQYPGSRSYAKQLSRTLDAASAPVEHMGIAHRRPDVLVTEQCLHRTDVIPRFESMRRKGMAKGMAGGRFGDARPAYSTMHRPLEPLFVGMMPPDDARARVA